MSDKAACPVFKACDPDDEVVVIPGVHYQIPGVDQTITEGGLGNCLQAVVATIIAEPLEDVPHFLLFGPKWRDALNLYFDLYGMSVERVTENPFGVAIAIGMSPRGIKHAVLCVNGVMAHDPHPSRAGLMSVDYYLALWGTAYKWVLCGECDGAGIDTHDAALHYTDKGELSPCPACDGTGRDITDCPVPP